MSDIQTGDVPSGRRRKKAPFYARPQPPRTLLPTGSVTDACWFLADVNHWLKSVKGVQDLVRACHHAPSAYWQEALIHRYGEIGQVSDEEWAWLLLQPLGIHAGHPLFNLRQRLKEIDEGLNPPSINEEDTLIIWGASSLKGKPFYRTVGVLLRSEMRASAHRDHQDRSIVISEIGPS